MESPPRASRSRTRDAGLRRLNRVSKGVLFGATALAGAFAGIAAHSAPGHKARRAVVRTTTRTVRTTTQAATTAAPATTETFAPPPPPVTTQVAPVVTTGGS
jgi:hypothetical protein